jgi:hypothetical protein
MSVGHADADHSEAGAGSKIQLQDGTAPAALASSEGWWSNSFFSNLFGHE